MVPIPAKICPVWEKQTHIPYRKVFRPGRHIPIPPYRKFESCGRRSAHTHTGVWNRTHTDHTEAKPIPAPKTPESTLLLPKSSPQSNEYIDSKRLLPNRCHPGLLRVAPASAGTAPVPVPRPAAHPSLPDGASAMERNSKGRTGTNIRQNTLTLHPFPRLHHTELPLHRPRTLRH